MPTNSASDAKSPRWVRLLLAVEIAGVVGAGLLGGLVIWNSELPVGAPAPLEPSQISPDPSGVVSTYTFYIVGSEAEAAELRHNLEEGNNIRNALRLDHLHEQVLVASDAEEAGEITRAIDEGNRILAAFQAEDRVVNLVARI